MASPIRTPEFRAEAVRIALTSGLPRKQVASDFGVGFSTLSRWIQADQRNSEKPTAQTDMERELAELRRENRLLREERDVLKKPPSSLRSEANEVRFHFREQRRSTNQALVSDHGRQSARVSGLLQSPTQPQPMQRFGRVGTYPRTIFFVSWQLWQAQNDRGTERSWY